MYMGTFMKFQTNIHDDPSMRSKQKIIMRKQMRAVKLLRGRKVWGHDQETYRNQLIARTVK